MVDADLTLPPIGQRRIREQILGGDVHRYDVLGHKVLRRPQAGHIVGVGLGDPRVVEDMSRLAQLPQSQRQTSGGAQGVAIRADVGQDQKPVPRLQPLGAFQFCHFSSSSSRTRSIMLTIRTPRSMESSSMNCSSGV